MPSFDPVQLAQWTGGRWAGAVPAAVYGFCNDTRKIRAGDCFVALRTDRRDGHDFLGEAAQAGASAALVERAVPGAQLPQLVVASSLVAFQEIAARHRAATGITVVAVTGSCGKTSTKDLLARMLGPERTLKTEGNLNNFLGVPLTLTRLDPVRHRFAVVEAGINEPGEMARLAEIIQPDAAIVTMIGEAHLERLGSIEGIAEEKSRLPRAVAPDGFAVFPESCLCFSAFRQMRCPVLATSEGGERPARPGVERVTFETIDTTNSDYRQNDRHNDDIGLRAVSGCLVQIEQPSHLASSWNFPRLSPGMRSNAVLAVVTALRLGIEPASIQSALDQWTAPAFRGEVVETARGSYYVDCYNASPSSLIDSLTAFNERLGGTERLIVLGGMKELGAESPRLHREAAARLPLHPGDRLILVGAEAAWMREGLFDQGVPAEHIVMVSSAEGARAHLEGFRGSVFLKGSRAYALESLVIGDKEFSKDGEKAAC